MLVLFIVFYCLRGVCIDVASVVACCLCCVVQLIVTCFVVALCCCCVMLRCIDLSLHVSLILLCVAVLSSDMQCVTGLRTIVL